MHIEVPNLSLEIIQNPQQPAEESSDIVKQRVEAAHQRQLSRTKVTNNLLNSKQIDQHCQLSESDRQLMETAINKLGLSARAYHRILKVARTIADLADSEHIQTPHLTEAISYRKLDRAVFSE